jgi:hypothetical protein
VPKKKKQLVRVARRPVVRRRKRKPTSTAIVKVPRPELATQQSLSVIPKIKQTIENLERIRRFVSQCLNIDLQRAEAKAKELGNVLDEDTRKRLEIDWGTIPGVDKPFLMQPGAEKMMKWLQLRPKFITTSVDHPAGHLETISHVLLYSLLTGEEVFEGPDASCTTMETNFRYVWAEAKDPGQDEKERLKLMGMGRNREVWKRGSKVWVWQVRIDNPNIWNERNKVRQMAEKRGLVKCLRQMGAISAIFNADPSEWNLGDEQEDELEAKQDYTPEGRRILIDGKSPSGKYVTPEARRAQAKANQEAVLNRKLEDNAPHGHIPGSEGAKKAEAALKRVEAEDAKLAAAKNVTPKKEKPPKEKKIPPGCMRFSGTIHEIVHGMTPGKPYEKDGRMVPGRKIPFVKVRLNAGWFTIWSTTIASFFTNDPKLIGNVVECWVMPKVDTIPTIEGLKRINDQYFAEDGRTPIPREPGAEGD